MTWQMVSADGDIDVQLNTSHAVTCDGSISIEGETYSVSGGWVRGGTSGSAVTTFSLRGSTALTAPNLMSAIGVVTATDGTNPTQLEFRASIASASDGTSRTLARTLVVPDAKTASIDHPNRRFYFFIKHVSSNKVLTGPETLSEGQTVAITFEDQRAPAQATQLWTLTPDGKFAQLASGGQLSASANNTVQIGASSETTWAMGADGRIHLLGGAQDLVFQMAAAGTDATVNLAPPAPINSPDWNLQNCFVLRTERQKSQPMSYKVDLNGTNQAIFLPSLPVNDDDFTVETWIKSTVGGPLVSTGALTMQEGFVVSIEPQGRLLFGLVQGDPSPNEMQIGVTAPTSLLDGDWHHVACVRSGTQLAAYIDGEAYPMTNEGDTPQSPVRVSPFGLGFIGTAPEPAGISGPNDPSTAVELARYYFEGSLDDVRVWTRGLMHGEIVLGMHQQLTGAEPELAGYWPFDHGNALDKSPNKRNGTPQNSPAFGEAEVEIAKKGEPYLVTQAKLMQDYVSSAGGSGNIEETTGYRVVLSARDFQDTPLPCFVTLWADQAANITFPDGTSASIGPDGPGYTKETTALGELSLCLEANGKLAAPVLKVRADFMLPDERLIVSPDRHPHNMLANMTGDTLLGKDAVGNPLPVVQKGLKQAPLPAGTSTETANAVASTIAHAMSATVDHSVEPARPLERRRSMPLDAEISEARLPRYEDVRQVANAYDEKTDMVATHYLAQDDAVCRILVAENMPAPLWAWTPGADQFTSSETQVNQILDGVDLQHLDPMTKLFAGKRSTTATMDQLLGAAENKLQKRWFGESIFHAMESALHVVISTVETTVTHAVTAVVSTVKSIVVTVVDAAKKAVDAVLQTVEDAIDFVAAALKRLGADIASVVDYLRALFAWDDILLAHDVIARYLEQSEHMVLEAVQQSGAKASASIESFRAQLDAKFEDWKKSILGLGSPSQAMSGYEAKPRQDIQSNYLGSMLDHNAKHIKPDAAPSFPSAFNQGVEQFTNALGAGLENYISGVPSLLESANLQEIFSSPANMLDKGLAFILEIVKQIADAALGAAETLVQAITAALQTLLQASYAFCSQRINIPIVTSFYENVVMKGNGQLSILSLISLMAAIPATLSWKIINADDKPLFSEAERTQFLSISGNQYNWISLPDDPTHSKRSPILPADVVRRLGIGMGFTNAAAQLVWGIAVTLGDAIWLIKKVAVGPGNPKFARPLVFLMLGGQLLAVVATFPWGTNFSLPMDQLAFAMWASYFVPFISNIIAIFSEVWQWPGDAAVSAGYGAVYIALTIALWVTRSSQPTVPDRGVLEGVANLFTGLTYLAQGLRLVPNPIVAVLAIGADAAMYLANMIMAIIRAAADARSPVPIPTPP